MITNRPRRPERPFLLRYFVEILAVCTIAFIAQTGLVPFDFSLVQAPGSVRSFFLVATASGSFPDIVANIFLYVPLGALVHWSLKRRSTLRFAALPATLLVGGVLSVVIEWSQAFSPSRISSVIDVVCNICGVVVGVFLSSTVQKLVPRLIGVLLFELRSNPPATILKAYCFLLVVFAALPFSFSLDANQLRQSAKKAVLVPFGAVFDNPNEMGDTIDRTDERTLAIARWEKLRRWSRWAAESVSFAVLVVLLVPLLRDDYAFSARATVGLAWWLCALFAIVLSVMQFPIVSRGLDVTDILFRLFGVGAAMVLYPRLRRRSQNYTREARQASNRRSAAIAATATGAFIVYIGVMPLVFDFSPGRVETALASPAFLPFFGYFQTRVDLMMTDVIEKTAAYAVFAAMLSAGWVRIASSGVGPKVRRVLPVCLLVCVLIEFVQVFLPVRIPSLTDPILASLACVVGVVVQVHVSQLYAFATSHEMIGPKARGRTSAPAQRASLTNQLIGSLIEPYNDAPREAVPRKKPMPRD